MEFFDVVKERQSIRAFKKKDIEEEKIRKILKAANSAPSAGNRQAYEIVLVRDQKRKEALVKAVHGQDFIAEAPVVLIFCINPQISSIYGKRGAELYYCQDATIAASYTQLAATSLGLGSVWIGAYDEEKVCEIINAPKEMRPIAIIPIGYPDEKPPRTPRRKLEDIVHKEVLK